MDLRRHIPPVGIGAIVAGLVSYSATLDKKVGITEEKARMIMSQEFIAREQLISRNSSDIKEAKKLILQTAKQQHEMSVSLAVMQSYMDASTRKNKWKRR
jgi:hypothetical protein